MRHFFIFLITLYQKHLSPHKGFSCAYACYHHSISCSSMVKNIIAEHGVIAGWPLIKQQFKQCQTAYHLLINQDEEPPRRDEGSCYESLKKDTKDCAKEACGNCDLSDCVPDLPCDGCDLNLLVFKRRRRNIRQKTFK